jgi:hypothetical protein
MKLALLIGLTLDKQSGEALTELAPFDQTLKKFKEMVNRGEAPSDRFPVVQLWTTSGLGKSHQFKPSQMPVKVSAKAKAEAEVLRAKAAELSAVAVEARRVADEAKGQPGVAALREAAEAAEEAAQQTKVDADAAEAALK